MTEQATVTTTGLSARPAALPADLRAALNAKAVLIDKYAIISTAIAASGHPSTACSIGHLVATLMYHQMRWDPADPWALNNDRLVLSEGHAVPAIYPAYADLGGAVGPDKAHSRRLVLEDVKTLRQLDSVLDGHPNPALGVPFFDAATGSLGMGPSVAAGLGLAARLDGSDRRIYVIIGDGESREGQVWEAVDFIAGANLANVTLIFNANGQGQADYVSQQQSADTLLRKLAAYNLEPVAIDGHDVEQIVAALNRPASRPLAIVARTIKGWGSSQLMSGNWHGKPLAEKDVERAMKDLDAKLAEAGAPDPVATRLLPPKPTGPMPRPAGPITLPDPDFAKLLAAHPLPAIRKLADGIAKGKLATRRAYGLALAQLGQASEQIVALDGDVSNSTFAEYFNWMFPARFFECKIAEQNIVSAAAGLAAGGKIPFVSTFGKFLARASDQVELAIISAANIKLCGSHVGVTLGADGPSQMALADVAFFRSFGQRNVPMGTPTTPGARKVKPADAAVVVFTPCDGVSAWKLVELMANHRGACYMRTMRPDTPIIYKPAEKFPLGGYKLVRKPAKKGKLVLAAAGYMVHEALAAADLLAKKGIEAAVVDCYCLPMNADPLLKLAEGNGKLIVTVEDNYNGGLGSELAEAAVRDGRVRVWPMAVHRVPKSGGTPDEMLAMCGLDRGAIVKLAAKLVGK